VKQHSTGHLSQGTLHFQVFHMFMYTWSSQKLLSSLTFLRNIALILTHIVFALSGFLYLHTSGQVKKGITTHNSQLTTHLPQEHCTHPHTCPGLPDSLDLAHKWTSWLLAGSWRSSGHGCRCRLGGQWMESLHSNTTAQTANVNYLQFQGHGCHCQLGELPLSIGWTMNGIAA